MRVALAAWFAIAPAARAYTVDAHQENGADDTRQGQHVEDETVPTHFAFSSRLMG